jgi:hypothetical protein
MLVTLVVSVLEDELGAGRIGMSGDWFFLDVIGPYSHSVRRNLQERHTGWTSSHLTLRSLQLVQPKRDFLCERFGRIVFSRLAISGAGSEFSSAMTHGCGGQPWMRYFGNDKG